MASTLILFYDTVATDIYTLSLHDALPILDGRAQDLVTRIAGDALRCYVDRGDVAFQVVRVDEEGNITSIDRKSTRLNSSHGYISYAVFCLKKKKIND